MTVPQNEPTPRTLSLAISVLKGRYLTSDSEPAVRAALLTLDKIHAAYEDGRLDWCDEKVRVRQPRTPIGDLPGYGGYSGGGGLAAEAIADLENLAARERNDPDVRE